MGKIVAQPKPEDLHQDDVMCIVVIDGEIFSGSYDGFIKKWNSDLKLLQTWQAHQYPVYAMVGNSSGLFSSSSYGEVKEWDPKSGKQKNAILMKSPTDDKTGEVKSLFLYEDLLFAGDDKGNLTVWKPDFEIEAQKFLYVDIWCLVVSPDGHNIFTVRNNECIVSDFSTKFSNEMFAQTLSVRSTIPGRAPLAVDNKHVLVVERSGFHINVHKYETSSCFPLVTSLKDGHDMIINTVLLSGQNVVSAGWDSKFVLWDIPTSKKVLEVQWDNYINSMAWLDEDKRQVIAGGKGGSMVLVQL